jgi:Methyltransferase domain
MQKNGQFFMNNFQNKTRISVSIPARLWSEGKWYLIPLYYFLRTSDLAREGIENSGSYLFADHIYVQQPSGRYGVGYVLDFVLLHLPSAQSFRFRYLSFKKELLEYIQLSGDKKIRILYVPSGLAREYFEISEYVKEKGANIQLCSIDLDPILVQRLQKKSMEAGLHIECTQGDALKKETYQGEYDMILSSGFLDFLNETESKSFFTIVFNHLKKDGIFVTSGMLPHQFSEFLLRELVEIKTSYRSQEELLMLSVQTGFSKSESYQDANKLQTILVATK